MFDDRAQTGSATETEPRYRGLALLGEGGTAEVFLAALAGPTGFSKLVVLEQLRQHLCGMLRSWSCLRPRLGSRRGCTIRTSGTECGRLREVLAGHTGLESAFLSA